MMIAVKALTALTTGLYLAAALTAGSAHAQSAREGGYVGLRLIGGMSEAQDLSQTGFTGSLVENNVEDPTAAAGFLAGYRFDELPLRVEGELHHRFRMDLDVRDNAAPGFGYENNLSSTVALVSAAWELRLDGPFTPFLGAGVGWARNASDVERTNISTGAKTSTSESVDNLALGVQAGSSYEISRHWGLELAYRYLNMGEVDTGATAGGESVSADSYVTHDLNLSLLYRF
ncbi:MAG: outer membrane beta-barrel protein [Marivibrio sp.]|uniref:outer membrane protein n=1 Tax=Marivibrio sp. TaxID=2039719 RepID=UPI0032ECD7F6